MALSTGTEIEEGVCPRFSTGRRLNQGIILKYLENRKLSGLLTKGDADYERIGTLGAQLEQEQRRGDEPVM